jgi:hypothetical protein
MSWSNLSNRRDRSPPPSGRPDRWTYLGPPKQRACPKMAFVAQKLHERHFWTSFRGDRRSRPGVCAGQTVATGSRHWASVSKNGFRGLKTSRTPLLDIVPRRPAEWTSRRRPANAITRASETITATNRPRNKPPATTKGKCPGDRRPWTLPRQRSGPCRTGSERPATKAENKTIEARVRG